MASVGGKYDSPFQYKCSMGHFLEGPKPILRCPIRFDHHDCPGSLTRVGPGSRTSEKASK